MFTYLPSQPQVLIEKEIFLFSCNVKTKKKIFWTAQFLIQPFCPSHMQCFKISRFNESTSTFHLLVYHLFTKKTHKFNPLCFSQDWNTHPSRLKQHSKPYQPPHFLVIQYTQQYYNSIYAFHAFKKIKPNKF